MDHPSVETLRRFVLATLPEEVDAEVEAHLAGPEGGSDGPATCEPCLYAAREVAPAADLAREEGISTVAHALYGPDDAAGGPALAAVFRQALRRRFLVDREAALAPQLLAELDRRPPAARREAIRTARRYQLQGLSEELSARSRAAGFSDVGRALELAELAVEVADALDARLYHPKTIADRQALARAFLGNARRVASDLFGADRAFREAEAIFARGTRAAIAQADMVSLLASLRIDQARYGEAQCLLEEALETYQTFGEDAEAGRVFLKLGIAAGYGGDTPEAVKLFKKAAEIFADVGETPMLLHARHNEARWLVEANEPLEALARYEQARPLYEQHGQDPWSRLRRRWLEGKIHAGLGDLDAARAAFEEVRADAVQRELGYEVAMVSLELAIVHLERGDTAEVRRLAGELLPVFHSQDLHGHALGALYLFQQAAQNDTATSAFLRATLRYLQRARNNPYLRFEAPAP